jgi:tetratricopeptide (TPR) repeat protein
MNADYEIEKLIERQDWAGARRLIEIELQSSPEDHWFLTRLSSTYYEERDYLRALELTTRALEIAPECPLVLWDHAGTLEMLDRPREALSIYESLVCRGVDNLAYGECGEGRARARGLFADCFLRMGTCYAALGEKASAAECFRQSLSERGPGCQSIYPIAELRERLSFSRISRAPGI